MADINCRSNKAIKINWNLISERSSSEQCAGNFVKCFFSFSLNTIDIRFDRVNYALNRHKFYTFLLISVSVLTFVLFQLLIIHFVLDYSPITLYCSDLSNQVSMSLDFYFDSYHWHIHSQFVFVQLVPWHGRGCESFSLSFQKSVKADVFHPTLVTNFKKCTFLNSFARIFVHLEKLRYNSLL